MINKFARFAIGWSIFCLIMTVGMPFIWRLQIYFQFSQLQMDSLGARVASEMLRQQLPYLVLSFVLNAVALYAACRLMRRENWARITWIALRILPLVMALMTFFHDSGWITSVGTLIHIALLWASIQILCSTTANVEFTAQSVRANPEPPAV